MNSWIPGGREEGGREEGGREGGGREEGGREEGGREEGEREGVTMVMLQVESMIIVIIHVLVNRWPIQHQNKTTTVQQNNCIKSPHVQIRASHNVLSFHLPTT